MRRRRRVSNVRRGESTLHGPGFVPVVRRGPVLTVYTYVPLPLAVRSRREVYSYPFPAQAQRRRRVLRTVVAAPKGRMVRAAVRIRLPARLPAVKGSYVSVRGSTVNVHSANQVRRLLALGELNRRRYREDKTNRRKARHGQLDSPGAFFEGIVGHAIRRGLSIGEIADAALVARALRRR